MPTAWAIHKGFEKNKAAVGFQRPDRRLFLFRRVEPAGDHAVLRPLHIVERAELLGNPGAVEECLLGRRVNDLADQQARAFGR